MFLFLLRTKVAANHAVHKEQSCAMQCKDLKLGRFGINCVICSFYRIGLKNKAF